MQSLEACFWAKVWQCTHRHPCKKCCWPWKGIDLCVNWKCVWQQHAIFTLIESGHKRQMPAHKFAYECRGGRLLWWGCTLHICHQCDFGPCCNPWHLIPGASSDNLKEIARMRTSVHLPDGRRWSYDEACRRQAAFYEAMEGRRVYAGEIPRGFMKTAFLLESPWGNTPWGSVARSRRSCTANKSLSMPAWRP